jgi:outer membrane protein
MKRIILTSLALAFLLIFLPHHLMAADMKVGYVDFKQAFEESLAGVQAKLDFSEKAKVYQQELDGKRKEVDAFTNEYEGQKLLLSEDARKNKEKEIREKYKEFQTMYKENQEKLREYDEKTTKKILAEMHEVVGKLGTQEGYSLILEKTESMILYAPESMNITQKLIDMYNASYLEKKKGQ